jgi:hypothetical protein
MEQSSYKYAIPYLIFFGYLLVLLMVEHHKVSRQQSTKDVRVLTVAGFLFFFGLRGFVCTDWYSYYPYFEQLNTLWSGGLWQPSPDDAYRYNVGFKLYSVLIKSIYPSYFFWVFVSTAIDVALLHTIFKRYVARYYVLAFMLFFVFHGEVMEVNLMRNIKSILIFMLSLKYLQERRMLPYMLLNAVGISFHISAVAYLPLYFVLHREFSRQLFWVIFIVGNILFLAQVQYMKALIMFVRSIVDVDFLGSVSFYLTKQQYGISIGYVERVMTFALTMWLLPKLKRQSSSSALFINMYMLYIVSFFYFGESSIVSLRMSYLFIGAYWILFPNMLPLLQIRGNRQLLVLLIAAYTGVKTLLLHVGPEMKYDNVAFGIEAYESRKATFESIYKKGDEESTKMK